MNLSDFKKFFSVTPQPLGLDISDTSIKYAQLSPEDSGDSSLYAFGEAKTPKGAVVEGKVKKPGALKNALRKAIIDKPSKELSQYIAALLPDEEVFLKKTSLPQMKEEELENSVYVEAERNVPVKLENAYVDYSVLNSHQKNEHLDVLIAVARKEVVDVYKEAIQSAGLTPFILEPEVFAISRSAIKNQKTDKLNIVAEIGANRTRLIAFIGEAVILTTAADFKVEDVANSIGKVLNLNEEKTKKLEWNREMLKDETYGEKIANIVKLSAQHLAEEIDIFIKFLEQQEGEEYGDILNAEKILLSGGGARLPGFDKFLSDQLKINVEVANPWVNILPPEFKELPELKAQEAVRFTAALGAALRNPLDELK